MNSEEFKLLSKRMNVLKRRFITAKVKKNPTTFYSQDFMKSFRILFHSEIEYYFESIAIKKVEKSLSLWLHDQTINATLLGIMAFSRNFLPNVPRKLSEISNRNDLNFRIHSTVKWYKDLIEKSNNGIKENNIIPIIVPLGIDYTKINQELLSALTTYGSKRGELAHVSYAKVINIMDPSDEIQATELIVTEIKILDELLNCL